MARPCKTCIHPDRQAIDEAIVAGRELESLGQQYGLSPKAISRHRTAHLSPALMRLGTQAATKSAAGASRTALSRIEALATKIEKLVDEASSPHALLSAAKELRAAIELSAKLSGELRPDAVQVAVFSVATDPTWIATKREILEALAPYPDAREAVAMRLLGLAQGDAPRLLNPGEVQ